MSSTDTDIDFLDADAEDRRAALADAVALLTGIDNPHLFGNNVLSIAQSFYIWLRERESIKPVRLVITTGPVMPQETS